MKTTDFDFELPKELIAQKPVEPRDHSKLMVVNRATGEITHDHFYNLTNYLSPDDLLVFNQTKVFPARLFGVKKTGGKVEILLLQRDQDGLWEFISHPGLKDGQEITFSSDLHSSVHMGKLKFNLDYSELMGLLERIGHTPLPPYINDSRADVEAKEIRNMYQTIYAKEVGSVAAPTAGLHFTKSLLDKIPNQTFITLHVGLGTFKPVKTDNIEDHLMHSERYDISDTSLEKINSAKRIIAVGTTSVRTIESYANTGVSSGDTNIFIYPGYTFKKVDAMITNFHLPKSTLLMLISAFAGRDLVMKAYREAIENKYRFYSFGDAMLII